MAVKQFSTTIPEEALPAVKGLMEERECDTFAQLVRSLLRDEGIYCDAKQGRKFGEDRIPLLVKRGFSYEKIAHYTGLSVNEVRAYIWDHKLESE